jgi:hypothetical protein
MKSVIASFVMALGLSVAGAHDRDGLGASAASASPPGTTVKTVVQINQCDKPIGYLLASATGEVVALRLEDMTSKLYLHLLAEANADRTTILLVVVPCGTPTSAKT